MLAFGAGAGAGVVAGEEVGATARAAGPLAATDGAGAASVAVVEASVAVVATVVEVCSTMKSSTSSTCLAPLARRGAALAKSPPPTAAMARQAIPKVVVAVTEYVIASRRSTRSPFVIISSYRS
jgi:hypothetical protein